MLMSLDSSYILHTLPTEYFRLNSRPACCFVIHLRVDKSDNIGQISKTEGKFMSSTDQTHGEKALFLKSAL